MAEIVSVRPQKVAKSELAELCRQWTVESAPVIFQRAIEELGRGRNGNLNFVTYVLRLAVERGYGKVSEVPLDELLRGEDDRRELRDAQQALSLGIAAERVADQKRRTDLLEGQITAKLHSLEVENAKLRSDLAAAILKAAERESALPAPALAAASSEAIAVPPQRLVSRRQKLLDFENGQCPVCRVPRHRCGHVDGFDG